MVLYKIHGFSTTGNAGCGAERPFLAWGIPMEDLTLSQTSVRDITALMDMPLRRLNLRGCANIRDLTPLAECEELRDLILPPNATEIDPAGSGINFLRQLPSLERISYQSWTQGTDWTPAQTAEEFWAAYDAGGKTVTSMPRRSFSAKAGEQLSVNSDEEREGDGEIGLDDAEESDRMAIPAGQPKLAP
jgi:hypothetical protein